MKTYKCNFDVPTILVSSILAGDLIWIDSSQIPAKFSIFLMGRPNPKRAALSHKDWLKLQMQESNANKLDDEIISKLAEFKLEHPTSILELRHNINNLLGTCRFLFLDSSITTSSILTWVNHLDEHEILYESLFTADPLFGLKICLTIDRSLQLFLQSCQNAKNFEEVNFNYLDFKFDQQSIERGRFVCNPPPPLIELFDNKATSNNNNKFCRRNALQDSYDRGTDNTIQNNNRNNDWILSSGEDYRRVFPQKIWSDDPPPKCEESGKHMCPRFHSKGYCFKNCVRSHATPTGDMKQKYHTYQQKLRRLAR